jgi:hypothetical protein
MTALTLVALPRMLGLPMFYLGPAIVDIVPVTGELPSGRTKSPLMPSMQRPCGNPKHAGGNMSVNEIGVGWDDPATTFVSFQVALDSVEGWHCGDLHLVTDY